MIRRIEVKCLGPHEALILNLDPEGTTRISGPSEAGKSFIMRATSFALWGCDLDGKPLDPAAIRDGHDKAEVALTLKTGSAIARTKTRGGSLARSLQKNGDPKETFKSDDAFRVALGKVGSPDLRLAMFPLAWQPLAAGNARPLRDFLTGILPPADLRAEVKRLMDAAQYDLCFGDPIDAKGAEVARRDANRAADEASGALTAATSRLADAEAMTVPTVPADLEAQARQTLALAEEWEAHRQAHAKWVSASTMHAAAVQTRDEWRKRRAEVGEAPKGEGLIAAQDAARAAVSAAEDALVPAIAGVRTAEEALRLAQTAPDAEVVKAEAALAKARAAYEAAPKDDVCDRCNRPGWEEAVDVRDEATRALRSAEAALADAEKYALTRRQKAEKAAAKVLAEAEAAEARLRTEWEAKVDAADAADEAFRAFREEAAAHAAAVKALGPEPTVPAETPAPKPLASAPPNDATIEDARSLLDSIKEAKGAATAKAEAIRQAKAALTTAETSKATTTAEATRLDALVSAVRQAPSEIAKRQAEALGDLGPVSLVWGDGDAKSPAVEVRIDGRAWDLASTGRQIVADLWLRAAFRRAMGTPWAGLFVDRDQDVGGQPLPEVGGPVIILETTKEPKGTALYVADK